jgi:hypothetical protein
MKHLTLAPVQEVAVLAQIAAIGIIMIGDAVGHAL